MEGRVVLHSDLNNCYASIECMLHPELRGKYIAVCGSTEDRHGIVLAKNQLAKQCGVKTGEVIWEAKQKCPQLTIVEPHMEQYLKFSKIVRSIYLRYSPEVESYLEQQYPVSDHQRNRPYPVWHADPARSLVRLCQAQQASHPGAHHGRHPSPLWPPCHQFRRTHHGAEDACPSGG